MKAVVIGASAGVGRALSQQLAARGDALVLVARDMRDLAALGADLRLRLDAKIHLFASDIARPDCAALHDFIAASLGSADAIFLIAGMTSLSDHGAMPDDRLTAILQTNFEGPARILNALLPLCGARTDIVAAGSVAAIRPRGSNGAYGAAKAGLEHYCMAIRHARQGSLRSVRCYRLGYIRTAMTFGQNLALPAVTAEAVAAAMISSLGKGGVSYFPRWWALVAFALRAMPWPLFRKMRA